MPTTRPFAYNTGSTISNTTQVGNLAVVTGGTGDYSGNIGGVNWWMGPDEDLGYVIAHQSPNGQPNPVGKTAYLGFWRSTSKTDNSFLSLANYVSNNTQNFTDGNTALTWLNTNGYWTSFTAATTLAIDYLVVAGGAGSGADNRSMGGSGAGGFLSGSTTFTLNSPLTVTVGAGGTKITRTDIASPGNKGNNSSITGTNVNIVATGGGATSPGGGVENGGSGAGASVFSSGISNALGTGISGQGNNGGNGCTSQVCGNRYAGGGGGAGAIGQDGNATNGGGDGGNGLTWYNGITYAGKKGGSTYASSNAGTGGTGGGGNGGTSTGQPTDGGINTGGGGGGGAAVNRTSAGGSGVVIIRYIGTTQKATGGTITTSGGYTYHTFTGTGTFTPTSS